MRVADEIEECLEGLRVERLSWDDGDDGDDADCIFRCRGNVFSVGLSKEAANQRLDH